MSTSSFPFPNSGQVLQSSAMTPQSVATMFQKLALLIFNIPVDPQNPGGPPADGKPAGAYYQVRVGYQQDGQPAWNPDEDVCIIYAKSLRTRFSSSRDRLISTNDDVSVSQQMSFTQQWSVHFSLYGPTAYSRASAMVSAQDIDWVAAWLRSPPPPFTPNGFFIVADYTPPAYVPENFQRQWWNRVDIDLKFNELVMQSIVTPSAAGGEITITTDTGVTDTFPV